MKAIRVALAFLRRGLPTERGMGEAATKEMVALKRAIKAALRHIDGDRTIADKDMAVLRAAVGGEE